jgi:transposase
MSDQSPKRFQSADKRVRRTFSSEFKRSKVKQIESGIVSVVQVAREFEVSPSAVYKWIELYGSRDKSTQVVVQLDSEEHRTRLLRQQLHELERAVGRKQMEIDYLQALIEAGSQELGIDLKKTFGQTPSRSSDSSSAESGQ